MSGVTPAARAAAIHASMSATCQSYRMASHATERRAWRMPSAAKRRSEKTPAFWSAMPKAVVSLPLTGVRRCGVRASAEAGATRQVMASSATRRRGNRRMAW
jgi:hypothetical protein